MGLIYLLFQYTELAALSITPSDSLLKMQCFCIFWLLCDLLEAAEWDQGRGGLNMLCQLLEPELGNSRRTRFHIAIKKKKVVLFLQVQKRVVFPFSLGVIDVECEGECFP